MQNHSEVNLVVIKSKPISYRDPYCVTEEKIYYEKVKINKIFIAFKKSWVYNQLNYKLIDLRINKLMNQH